ncbi:MAG: hypothetical protein WBE58_12950 [Verrucomicrobiales bacterium]
MLKEFFRDKSSSQILAIMALGVLFLSQFFYYLDDENTGFLTIGPDFSYSTLHHNFGSIGTGWQLHPQAYLILLILAFVLLREDVVSAPWFERFGYWMVLVLFIAATTPGAPFRATGAGLGGIATIMALVAAVMNHRARKQKLRAASAQSSQQP